MATNQAFDVPFAGRWKEPTEHDDGEEIVSEPVGDEAAKKIWTSQVMIPFSIRKNVYAFCGPYPGAEITSSDVAKFFPKYVTCGLRIFETDPYHFGYFKNPLKLFRSAPYTAHKDYIPWLNRVEKEYKGYWENYGIYPLIQFSTSLQEKCVIESTENGR
ncbi:hypothetical protein QL285_057480 [Trifolium repens]|nr:hypothetical protein QL285_057480 [Trifolium repens]